MNDSEPQWQKLVAAARRAAAEPAPRKPPPPDFAGRILSLRESIIALARVLFWRRWSLWMALLCVAIFVATLITHRCTESRLPLIETPAPPATQPMIR